MTTSGTPYDAALQDLAEAIRDPDFEQDPCGVLQAWLGVALGDVTPEDRYRPSYIASDPERGA